MTSLSVAPLSPTKSTQSELSDPDSQAYEPHFQTVEAPSQGGYSMDSLVQRGRSDDFNAPGKLQSSKFSRFWDDFYIGGAKLCCQYPSL